MAQNVPVSDLRDYKKVLDRVEEEAPVNLTVQTGGRFCVFFRKDTEPSPCLSV